MTAISYATAVDPRTLPFKDRRTSLKVVGVLLILFGSLFACFGILTPVGMFVASMAAKQMPATQRAQMGIALEPDMQTIALAGGTYLVIAAALIWIGIGSVRVRRWARPVLVVVGWTWLLTGVMSLAHWAILGASMREMMSASLQPGMPAPPRGVVVAVSAAMGALMFVFLVVLPALLVWLYQRRGVRETVEYFDSRYSWTD